MKIDREWLTEKGACQDGKDWFVAEGITEPIAGIKNLVAKDHWEWANWLIVRVMSRKQYLAYAIFAAEQVLDIYERKYPDDKRPQKAIEAARMVLKNDTLGNRNAAAYAAARAAARAAAGAAAWAAWAAGDLGNRNAAAYAAAWAAWAAGDLGNRNAAAYAAAWAAWAAGDAALKEMRLKIINYGLKLLSPEEKKK